MMSPEQFAQMMATIQQTLGARHEASSERGGCRLIAKHFRSETFTGDQTKWDDWSFAFKRCVRSMHKDTFKTMSEWETRDDEVDEETELAQDMEQRSAELYDILCQFCSGEALLVVRSVGEMEGIKAWQKLFKKYNPRTMARGLRMLSEAVNPPRVKNLSDVETAVATWEEKVKRLACQFEEKLSDKMKMAVFTNLMPDAIQDYIYTHADKETKYEELREKVRAMISNKVSVNAGPVPMDVGDVGGKWEETCGEQTMWGTGEEYEVDGVANHYQCRNCQGYGHFARECPSKGLAKGGKGIGKSGKGKGTIDGFGGGSGGWATKGKGPTKGNKGGAKGAAKGDKGRGTSFAGTCWTCGKAGHRANECGKADANGVDEWSEGDAIEEQSVSMGGVWEVGHVAVKTSNRFAALAVEEVNGVSGENEGWKSLLFNEAGVTKPLASAAKVVEAGNRVVLSPEASYIENVQTGEKVNLRREKGVFVFDVQFQDGDVGTITLDSGAGVSVWPKGWKPNFKTEPKKTGLKMIAANGTEIENVGQKRVLFKTATDQSVFSGRSR